jgi:sugar O-acyltransferase (sialic acid O-acetyltransferase NeuD family)
MKVASRRYVLWGSAGHAKVLAGILAHRGDRVVALYDNRPDARSSLEGVPLFIGLEGFAKWRTSESVTDDLCGLVAIGGARGRDRIAIQNLLASNGLRVEPLVDPAATVAATATLGVGTHVLAQSVVAASARVGEACIINHRGGVDHECVLGAGVHVAPGATLCGNVVVGDGVMIGAGAVVLPGIKIDRDTIVGAGAVVTHDLPAGVVAVGNPARVVRNV